jgi:hypothetical protein
VARDLGLELICEDATVFLTPQIADLLRTGQAGIAPLRCDREEGDLLGRSVAWLILSKPGVYSDPPA